MNSHTILNLIRQRHPQCVFVPECKNGPSWGNSMLRLDAWVMSKSWSKPHVWGYEIKVSRSDFIQDDKYQFYKEYCNSLYLACPPDVIKIDEVPKEIGLLYVSSTGGSLICKRKAAYRSVTIPEKVFRYILMARAVIDSGGFKDSGKDRSERAAYWSEHVKRTDEYSVIGANISSKLRQAFESIRRENERLKTEAVTVQEHIELICKITGLEKHELHRYDRRQRLENALASLPNGFRDDLAASKVGIERLITALNGHIK